MDGVEYFLAALVGFLFLSIVSGFALEYKLEQRKLDIIEKNGCATVMVTK